MSRFDVQWTKQGNKFVTWSSEFSLYQTEPLRDGATPTCKISETLGATLLATIPTHYYAKCFDVHPGSDKDVLLAVGQANGKVMLTTFGPSVYDSLGLPGREFAFRNARSCNAVAWNPAGSHVVVGLDKYRSEHSILLWDIMKGPSPDNLSGLQRLASEYTRPVMEYGLSETTHSLSWFKGNANVLAAGMNMKNIRILDTRDSNKAMTVTVTKAVYGVCVDPNNDTNLASYVDNQIYVWDTRTFEKPIIVIPHTKTLTKLSWCPTKHNLLGALHKDSSSINLYDIQRTMIGNEDVEPSVLEREVRPRMNENVTSFAWHPTDEYRMLTVVHSGNIIDYRVFDRITLNWAPNSNMVWTYGRKTMKGLSEKSALFVEMDDISKKMKERAVKGYGLKDELYKNGVLVDNVMLAGIWAWLHLSKKLVEEGVLRGYTSKHPGIRDVLKLDSTTNKSELVSTTWSDLGSNASFTTTRMYKHEDRDKALHLCGWYFDKDQTNLTSYLDQLVAEKAYTRAAAIAVFNLKVRQAIDILNKGAERSENLNIVAMALAGFTEDKNSMWRQFCSSPKMKLNDPYLRAMFAFLTAENFNYDNVLNEHEISVDDRVAFACIFLSDNKLYEYLKSLNMKLMNDGNLDGMLLTGNNIDGVRLLQKYLDITGDIQSTVLIAVRAFAGELLQEVQDWITGYRNLLDSWQLWNERALFDIMFTAQRPNDKPPQQVYVSCNFCGKSISAYMQGLNRGRGPFSRMGGTANKLKMSSCPNCRKPLPRCVICLMHMGTTTGIPDNADADSNKLIDFSNWFTWCQTCRHGGHSSHMVHWFKEHSECPVTACTCRCFSVDSIGSTIPT